MEEDDDEIIIVDEDWNGERDVVGVDVGTPGGTTEWADEGEVKGSNNTGGRAWHECNAENVSDDDDDDGGDDDDGEGQEGPAATPRNGHGTMLYTDHPIAMKYDGPWKDGLWHGENGSLLLKSGDSYTGSFHEGRRHGFGKYRWADGREYIGEFDHGDRHGQGRYVWPSPVTEQSKPSSSSSSSENRGISAVYQGSFVRNQREGHGKYVDSRVEYAGDWKDGMYHGYGVYQWSSGPDSTKKYCHRGNFVAGKPHGHGVLVNPDGSTKEGEWQNGILVKPSSTSSAPSPRAVANNGYTAATVNGGNKDSDAGSSTASGNNNNAVHEETARSDTGGPGAEATNSNAVEAILDATEHTESEAELIVPASPKTRTTTVVNNQEWYDEFNHRFALYRGLWDPDDAIPEGNGTAEYQSLEKNIGGSVGDKKDIGSSGEIAFYEGCFRNGRYHGKGRLTWRNGDMYEGEFDNGERHGEGMYRWKEGSAYYRGGFDHNVRHGTGTYMYANSDMYEGGFLNGQRHGFGKFVFADGSVYEGEWQDGQYHGQGMLILLDGRTLKGRFEHGLLHGEGTELNSSGRVVYDGEWLCGRHADEYLKEQEAKKQKALEAEAAAKAKKEILKKDNIFIQNSAAEGEELCLDEDHSGSNLPGELLRDFPAPDVDSGDAMPESGPPNAPPKSPPPPPPPAAEVECEAVVDEPITDSQGNPGKYTGIVQKRSREPHGVGRLVYSDGKRIHEGFWKDGKKEGHGRCLFFPQGDLHEGEYRDNLRHGPGKYVWKDGRTYVGEYEDDLRHGHGVFTYPTGERYEGDFSRGQRSGHGRLDFGGGNGYYFGEWSAGKYDGKGLLVWGDGSSYEGEFAVGAFNGQGKRKGSTGEVLQEGYWIMGTFKGGVEDAVPPPGTSDDDGGKEEENLGQIPTEVNPSSSDEHVEYPEEYEVD